MYTVTVSSKGQIVLPRAIRQELGLQEGDKLSVTLEENSVCLKRLATPAQPGWHKWRGVLTDSAALDEHLADHAEEVNRERLS